MSERIKRHSKIVIAFGLILAIVAMYRVVPLVTAGTVTSRNTTLTDSRPSAASDWDIEFVTESLVDDNGTDTITVTIEPAGQTFDLTGIDVADIDLEDDTVDKTLASDCTGSEHFGVGVNTGTDVITFTCCDTDTGDIAIGSTVNIKIGTNADSGVDQIDNPAKVAATGTADTYDVDIAGTFGDTGTMVVAIQDGVTVSATVEESLSFTIGTVAAGSCTGDTGSPTVNSTSAADAVDFGTLAADAFEVACHELSVGTNATDGYALTSQETTSMLYSTETLDDTTCDGGACTESAQDDWATASANQGLGHGCTNTTGTDCNTVYTTPAGACGAAPCYRQFACVGSDANCDPGSGGETAQTLMSNSGAVSSSQSKIHYKISRTSAQPAGSYQNVIVYIVTPTY